jgi:hypothetical protein
MELHTIREQTSYYKREERSRGTTGNECLLCGRQTKGLDDDSTRSVGMNTDGTLTLEPDATQGWFPVGPDCYRKYIHASDIDTDYWMAKAGGEPTTYVPGFGWMKV